VRRGPRAALRVAAVAAFGVLALGAGLPSHASAHPLGNFTINHYAGIRVGRDAIQLDVVIDMAEIPAFSEQRQLDTNGETGPSRRRSWRRLASQRARSWVHS